MIFPKKMIIVSHYNSKQSGKYLTSRNNLINLLDFICKKHSIPFIDPTIVLSKYNQEEVMTDYLGHFTQFGIDKFSNYINDYIKTN